VPVFCVSGSVCTCIRCAVFYRVRAQFRPRCNAWLCAQLEHIRLHGKRRLNRTEYVLCSSTNLLPLSIESSFTFALFSYHFVMRLSFTYRPRYTSVRPFVCSVLAPNLKTIKHRKTNIGLNVPRCANFDLIITSLIC